MNRIRRLVALALLPLWVAVAVHCGLELNGAFGPPVPPQKTSHASDAGAADTDPEGGHAIEDGHFAGDVAWFAVTQPAPIMEFMLPDIPVLDLAPVLARSPEDSHPPPGLVVCWSFERRAAPSPRAPALLS